MPYQFNQVTEIYSRELGTSAPARILDTTANVGCDTIQFKRMYPGAHVTAVEIDKRTATLLGRNMAKLARVVGRSPQALNPPVETRHMDCLEYLKAADCPRADLVYFDIPWGGPEYYRAPSMKLVLSGLPLGDTVGRTLAKVSPLVVVKMPVNADVKEFQEAVGAHVSAAYSMYDVEKPKGNRKGKIAYRLVFARLVEQKEAPPTPVEPLQVTSSRESEAPAPAPKERQPDRPLNEAPPPQTEIQLPVGLKGVEGAPVHQ